MQESILFQLGLGLLIVHELDAVRCKEWRIFPGLSRLNEKLAANIFIIAHLPIFYFLVIGLTSSYKSALIFWLDLFFIIHLVLHIIYLWHPRNEFKDITSWIIISAVAIFGILDLFF